MPSAADTLDTRLPFACVLAALAGAVDATAVLSLGDIFVSFMSGNTTLLGNAVAHRHGLLALRLALVLLAFVSGVVWGELLATAVDPARRPAAVLTLVAVGLAASAACHWRGVEPFVVALCLAASMGVQNATVRRAGGIEVALTYVTGTLVRLGRAVAAAVIGRAPWRAASPIAFLWLSFAAGAVAGALGATVSPSAAMVGMAAAAALLAVYATFRSPASRPAGTLTRSAM